MFTYRLYGIVLASPRPFPELPEAAGAAADIALHFLPDWEDVPPGVEWFHDGTPEGETAWLTLGRQHLEYVLRFPGWVHYRLSAARNEIFCQHAPEIPEETVRHLFLDQVLPMVLAHGGQPVLHASAVARGGDAVGFLGSSGRGKTTLAASLCRHGFALLADDCLVLELDPACVLAQPSYPGVRYWPEAAAEFFGECVPGPRVAHYTDKLRLVASANAAIPFHAARAQVKRLYILADPSEPSSADSVTLTPLGPKDAFLELLPQAHRLDMMNREKLQEDFERLNRLARLIPFRRLSYPRTLDALPRVRDAILADLDRAD